MKFVYTQRITSEKRKINSKKIKENKLSKTQCLKLTDDSDNLESPQDSEQNNFVHEIKNPFPCELPSQPYPLPEIATESRDSILTKTLIIGDVIAKGTYSKLKSAYHKELKKIVAVKIYD